MTLSRSTADDYDSTVKKLGMEYEFIQMSDVYQVDTINKKI